MSERNFRALAAIADPAATGPLVLALQGAFWSRAFHSTPRYAVHAIAALGPAAAGLAGDALTRVAQGAPSARLRAQALLALDALGLRDTALHALRNPRLRVLRDPQLASFLLDEDRRSGEAIEWADAAPLYEALSARLARGDEPAGELPPVLAELAPF